jgi:MFS family permease
MSETSVSTTTDTKPTKRFYGWVVVVINMLVLMFGTGLVNNSSGQFLKQLTVALEITRAEANLYSSIMTILMIILIPQVTKIFKVVAPRIVSSVGVFCVAGGWFFISMAQSKWHLYICAAFVGIGLSFCATSMVTMIVGNWFVKNKGKALGLALLGSGIGAFAYNPICAYLIEEFGFRTAYQITAGILLVGMIPYLLLYSFKPADKGQVPLGFDAAAKPAEGAGPDKKKELPGLMYKEARKTPAFWMVCFIAIALNACTIGVYTQMQAYLTDVGHAAVLAASVISTISICNAFAKMIFGFLNDLFGTKRTYFLAMTVFFIGLVLMLFAQQSIIICFVAGVFFGFGLACPSVITPMVTMAALGQRDFAAIYSRVSSFFFLGSTIGPIFSGFIFDTTGAYTAAIVVYAVFLVISVIIGTVLLRKKTFSN